MSDQYDGNTEREDKETGTDDVLTSPEEEKLEYSKACVAGFVFSLLALVFVIVSMVSSFMSYNIVRDNPLPASEDPRLPYLFIIMLTGTVTAFVLCFVSFIISTAGLITSVKKIKKGKWLGIAGITLSSILAIAFIFFIVAFHLKFSLLEKNSTPQRYNGMAEIQGVFEYKHDKDRTEATVLTWYWNGDPQNKRIEIGDETLGNVKITGIGDEGSLFPAEFRVKIRDSSRDYYQTDEFKRSPAFKSDKIPTADNVDELGVGKDTKVKFRNIFFTVVINKDIGSINIIQKRSRAQSLGYINDDGSITIYRIHYRFECDPDNKIYYSLNGVLYSKIDDDPVFVYLPE